MPITVENLSHTYSPNTPFSVEAVKEVSFTLEDGEFLGIIGHTGSGKSTLASHLNGLTKAQVGKVTVDGVVLREKYDRRAIRTKVGMVFQYPEAQLFEETVEKDVCFGPKNMGCDAAEQKRRAKEALELMGLDMEEIGSVSPFDLSGGQKRRVAISGVLAMEPKYLVMDEPMAGLDPITKNTLMALVQKLHKETGMGMVMVSHNMDDIAQLSDRILVMDKGEMALLGTPYEIFSQGDRLREMGLDIPQTYRLVKELGKRGLDVPFCQGKEALADAIAAALKGVGGDVS
ncbi:energy-coupling factor transporter ATPase [Eubacteriales bacterium OttesenSCG-928-M02]|nr:energy-coupling factor transporter ATPase [Eubacteriales bacterium OttesenSCG-928-M02]